MLFLYITTLTPSTIISLKTRIATNQNGTILVAARNIKTDVVTILSANGSQSFPKLLIDLKILANNPSNKSNIIAKTKKANIRDIKAISIFPYGLNKPILYNSQYKNIIINIGATIKIRIIVSKLGRFFLFIFFIFISFYIFSKFIKILFLYFVF
ncbi:Hypothetical protein MCYN_0459 [Mycoplasmopsis cynos C142]|uniref:Uncharacterized protein n=1 Tax=Mycoplasmopsis cynos (strain C142) TaxID=1246955 RepID=L0RX70_MYCC1|nr:Hypothetical protein MCYN_0459 [Mycoplasmopsis cynos C142]